MKGLAYYKNKILNDAVLVFGIFIFCIFSLIMHLVAPDYISNYSASTAYRQFIVWTYDLMRLSWEYVLYTLLTILVVIQPVVIFYLLLNQRAVKKIVEEDETKNYHYYLKPSKQQEREMKKLNKQLIEKRMEVIVKKSYSKKNILSSEELLIDIAIIKELKIYERLSTRNFDGFKQTLEVHSDIMTQVQTIYSNLFNLIGMMQENLRNNSDLEVHDKAVYLVEKTYTLLQLEFKILRIVSDIISHETDKKFPKLEIIIKSEKDLFRAISLLKTRRNYLAELTNLKDKIDSIDMGTILSFQALATKHLEINVVDLKAKIPDLITLFGMDSVFDMDTEVF